MFLVACPPSSFLLVPIVPVALVFFVFSPLSIVFFPRLSSPHSPSSSPSCLFASLRSPTSRSATHFVLRVLACPVLPCLVLPCRALIVPWVRDSLASQGNPTPGAKATATTLSPRRNALPRGASAFSCSSTVPARCCRGLWMMQCRMRNLRTTYTPTVMDMTL